MSFKKTGKRAVNRHQTQSKTSADSQERGIERMVRREGRKEIEEQLGEDTKPLNPRDILEALQKDGFAATKVARTKLADGRRHWTVTCKAVNCVNDDDGLNLHIRLASAVVKLVPKPDNFTTRLVAP